MASGGLAGSRDRLNAVRQEKKNYNANQRSNQNTDDQRNKPTPTIDRPRLGALLRRPYA